jgi:hypothetical protein
MIQIIEANSKPTKAQVLYPEQVELPGKIECLTISTITQPIFKGLNMEL